MRQLKIAFITTIPTDTIPFISALKTVNERFGEVAQARLWTGGDYQRLWQLRRVYPVRPDLTHSHRTFDG